MSRNFTAISTICYISLFGAFVNAQDVTDSNNTPITNALPSVSANINISDYDNFIMVSQKLCEGLIAGFQKTGTNEEIVIILQNILYDLLESQNIKQNPNAVKMFAKKCIQIVDDFNSLIGAIQSGDTISDTFIAQINAWKKMFRIIAVNEDIEEYLAKNKDKINQYTKDVLEMNESIGVTVPVDETGRITWSGELSGKQQYGRQSNGDFIESKEISFSQGLGANIFSVLKAKVSVGGTVKKGKKFTGINSIASNDSLLERTKSQLSSNATDEYLEYKKKLLTLLRITKDMPNILYRMDSLCRLFATGLPANYRFSFSMKDGKFTTELMKTLAIKASGSVSSSALSKINCNISVEGRQVTYKLENDALLALKDMEIKLGDKEFLTILGNLFGFSKQNKSLFAKNDNTYFSKLIQKSGLDTIQKLSATTKTYLQILKKLQLNNISKEEKQSLTKSKHTIEQYFGVNGRKPVMESLSALLGYYAYSGTEADVQELEDIKQDIIEMSEYLQYSNSIQKSKTHLKSYKAISTEQEVNISLLDNFLKYSYIIADGNPNIYENGGNMTLTIDISKLALSNRVAAGILDILGIKSGGDMPINSLVASVLQSISNVLQKHSPKKGDNPHVKEALNNLIQLIGEVSAAMSNVNTSSTSKNRLFSIVSTFPSISKNVASLIVQARANIIEKKLMIVRAFTTQEKGISIGGSKSFDSFSASVKGGVSIKAFSNNFCENPSTLYNIIKAYAGFADAYSADNSREVTQKQAFDFVSRYRRIDSFIEACRNGKLNRSIQSYVDDIKNSSVKDKNELISISYDDLSSMNDEQLTQIISKIAYLHHKCCAIPFKKKAYNKMM